MELRHLRASIALAEELHFGRAAQRLRIAQSAMSQLIKVLEDELGVVLFARTKRMVRLTAAGQRFVDGARRTLAGLAEMTAGVHGLAAGDSGRLVVNYVSPAALTELPMYIERFRQAAPFVEIVVEPASTVEQLDGVRQGRCDVGLVPIAGVKRQLEPLAFRVITRDPFVVLTSSKHRLASRTWMRFEDLRGERIVLFAQRGEPQVGAAFRKRCLDAGFDPDIVMEVTSADALLAFVGAGAGIAFVPDLFENLRHNHVRAIPVRPIQYGGIAAVWHPQLISPAGRRLLAMFPEVERPRRGRTG